MKKDEKEMRIMGVERKKSFPKVNFNGPVTFTVVSAPVGPLENSRG